MQQSKLGLPVTATGSTRKKLSYNHEIQKQNNNMTQLYNHLTDRHRSEHWYVHIIQERRQPLAITAGKNIPTSDSCCCIRWPKYPACISRQFPTCESSLLSFYASCSSCLPSLPNSRLQVLHYCFPGCSFSTAVFQVEGSPLLYSRLKVLHYCFPGCSFSTTVFQVVDSPLLFSRL